MKLNASLLLQHLDYLKLPFLQKHHAELAQQSALQHWDHVEYLRRLIEGEYTERRQRVIERRVKAARFPIIKSLEQFRWDWPKKINRLQVQHLFRLEFVAQKANVVLLGNVGLGKTHLAIALGYAACQEGYAVLFADAISVINDLSAAHKRGLLKRQLKKYLAPELLVLDELGYLEPVPKVDVFGSCNSRPVAAGWICGNTGWESHRDGLNRPIAQAMETLLPR